MSARNPIGWFDLYVSDLDRATAFYEQVFQVVLERIDDPTGETAMMSFPSDMTTYGASGALVRSNRASPGAGGTMVYFAVDDCAVEESRIAAAGGTVIRSKFSIGEFGWVTLGLDSEGNPFGLNSRR